MPNFIPRKKHLREILLHYFIVKKSAAETFRLLTETYGEHAPSKTTCRDWFRRFKNKDFDTEDKEHGKPPKKFDTAELEALLDEDPCQTQSQLAAALNVTQQCISQRLKAMGIVQKEGKWMSRELSDGHLYSL